MRRRAKRHHRVQRPDGVGQFERHLRDDGPQGDDGVFERTDTRTVSFQPNSEGSVGMMMLSQVTRFTHLHVVQVEVDRVGIDAVMRDAPDLGSIGCVRRWA